MPDTLEMPGALDTAEGANIPPATTAPLTPDSPIETSYGELEQFAKEPDSETVKVPKSPAAKSRQRDAGPPPPKSEEAGEIPPDEPVKTPEPKPPEVKASVPGKTKKPSDFLREELTKQKTRAETLEAELKAIKTSKPAEDPEKKNLSETLEKMTGRVKELEEKLKFTDYSQSDEFNERYHKPYVDAFNAGRSKTASFTTQEVISEEDGRILQPSRRATTEDFDRIMSVDDEQASELAEKLFGSKKAQLILWHRENVLQQVREQNRALEEFRKVGGERNKASQEQKDKAARASHELWEKLNKDAAEKYPQWFKPVEGDQLTDGDRKSNELLTKGFAKADQAFGGTEGMTPAQIVSLHSELRNKAGAFPMLVHKLSVLKAEVAQLRQELEQYEDSGPGPAEGNPPKPTEGGLLGTIDTSLDALDKIAKETL